MEQHGLRQCKFGLRVAIRHRLTKVSLRKESHRQNLAADRAIAMARAALPQPISQDAKTAIFRMSFAVETDEQI